MVGRTPSFDSTSLGSDPDAHPAPNVDTKSVIDLAVLQVLHDAGLGEWSLQITDSLGLQCLGEMHLLRPAHADQIGLPADTKRETARVDLPLQSTQWPKPRTTTPYDQELSEC